LIMIREFVASKTAKLLAACVCPVAGTGLVTMNVPQARNFVHKATAPRSAAVSPVARTPVQPAAVVPCGKAEPILVFPQVAGLSPIPATPFDLPALERSLPPTVTPERIASAVPEISRPQLPGGGVPPEDVPGTGVVPSTPLPEPASWAQIILGFGLIGATVRMAYRRDRGLTVNQKSAARPARATEV
jgi:hypothetical protein